MPSATRTRAGRNAEVGENGIYLDSSALAKLYVPEPESDLLEARLRGRRDLIISELAITEVLSAVARKRREGLLDAQQAQAIRAALYADADSGSLLRSDLSPRVHRDAEQLLLGSEAVPIRTLDALHIALALSSSATHIATFDVRMQAAAANVGLKLFGV